VSCAVRLFPSECYRPYGGQRSSLVKERVPFVSPYALREEVDLFSRVPMFDPLSGTATLREDPSTFPRVNLQIVFSPPLGPADLTSFHSPSSSLDESFAHSRFLVLGSGMSRGGLFALLFN